MEELVDTRISVSSELAEHYSKIVKMRDDILGDDNSEDRDKISIINATTSIIREVSKLQLELYNSEKFAVLQQVIVNVLRNYDRKIQQEVLAALEERLERI